MPKRILIVLSEWGYWGEELSEPLRLFDEAGCDVDFVTPTGRRPLALPVSMDPAFVDPPLGRAVVSKDVAARVARLEDPTNPRLAKPKNLTEWFPLNPYPSSPAYLREREAYFKELDARKQLIADRYDAVLLVGGSGPLLDLANNYRVHDLVRCFFELDRPIATECYATTALAFTTVSPDDGRPIIWGKHVTGHPRPYDYQEGYGFWERERSNYLETRFPTLPHQLVLELAVGPEGRFHGNVGKELSVVVDYPFVTGRSTGDSEMTGRKLLDVLEMGLRRYGW